MSTEQKPHKWVNEIKAWADGYVVQFRHWTEDNFFPWQDWNDDDFTSTPHFDDPKVEWRVKPRIARINGYEFPAPETEAPDYGTEYWVPVHSTLLATNQTWRGDKFDHIYLAHQRLHLTEDAAIAHAKAEILAVGGKLEEK